MVKEALESQIADLKQNMNQAGVKVDAVEVTVGGHEFERNLEQNAKQEEQQAEEREKAANATRHINLRTGRTVRADDGRGDSGGEDDGRTGQFR